MNLKERERERKRGREGEILRMDANNQALSLFPSLIAELDYVMFVIIISAKSIGVAAI